MYLYKYMKSEHVETFFHNGKLRIGTLLDFKRNEAFNAAVGDKNEGSHFPFIAVENIKVDDMNSKQHDFFKGAIEFTPGTTIGGFTLQKEIRSEDYYIFCLASQPSRAAMEKFECDTCIEIFKPEEFINALTRKLRTKTGPLVWKGAVTYTEKKYPYTTDIANHPATTKDPEYDYQKEYRLIWQAKNAVANGAFLEPFFVKAAKTIHCCRVIKL